MFFLANPEDQKYLVNRKHRLITLSDHILEGKNTAIVGPKKSGKTTLVKQIIETLAKGNEILPVFIGLNRTSTPPENFSIELVGGVTFWFLGAFSSHSASDFKDFQTIEHLQSISGKLGKGAADIIEFLGNELQKIKPNQKMMLEKAFLFAEEISKISGKKVLLVLDDFDDLLELNNFSQVKDVFSLIDFENPNVRYLVTSSSTHNVNNYLKDFTLERIDGFDESEALTLIENSIGKVSKNISDEIISLAKSSPVIIRSLSRRYSETKDVHKAFLIELMTKSSATYHFLDSALGDYLHRARGESMPKTVVKVMAFLKDARLTDIAKKIYRSAPVTKSLLERIMQVDLLVKVDNRYDFSDPLLKDWLRLVYSGYEFDEIPSDEIIAKAKEVLYGK